MGERNWAGSGEGEEREIMRTGARRLKVWQGQTDRHVTRATDRMQAFFTTRGKKYEEISGDVSEGREALGTCENTRLLAFTFSVTASGWRRRRVSGVTSPLGASPPCP